ncbi:hypothetical protein [Halomonas urumqiensis]|uniref:Rap1a immunity protein domain-containing protein n=1 Tax=Halomonas urumqiensis TaxID=1684789 RepID=A0A2N7UKV0_9GAMM|nr:hypothetical protein [Halomonas urumqiensis]PMR81038.1 hypothetical protein C1H70_06495 [Halomonas urumqiensis]PTB01105.1 hypothetical protein C6V82_16890 [Halomonas urumqiensis]GHE22833.1 hypothetical protein GCM10017767_33540 [Halomonas urumqiensis]
MLKSPLFKGPLTIIAILISFDSSAEMMTVQEVKDYYHGGMSEELIATSYSQGVFDGMIAMEGARRNEGKGGNEFCDLFEREQNDNPIRHPAYRTEQLIEDWQEGGYPMDAPFADLAISYLSGQYGC